MVGNVDTNSGTGEGQNLPWVIRVCRVLRILGGPKVMDRVSTTTSTTTNQENDMVSGEGGGGGVGGGGGGGLKTSECLIYTSFSLLIGAAILLGFGVKADQPVILCSIGALFLAAAFAIIIVGLIRSLRKLGRKHRATINGEGHGQEDAVANGRRIHVHGGARMDGIALTSIGFGLYQLNQLNRSDTDNATQNQFRQSELSLDTAGRIQNEAEFMAYLYRHDLPPSYRESHSFASISDYGDIIDSDGVVTPATSQDVMPPPAYVEVVCENDDHRRHHHLSRTFDDVFQIDSVITPPPPAYIESIAAGAQAVDEHVELEGSIRPEGEASS